MQSKSKQSADLLPSHQRGREDEEVAAVCTEKNRSLKYELKDHSPQDETSINETRWLPAARLLTLALLLYLFVPWNKLGGTVHLFQCIQEILRGLASYSWHPAQDWPLKSSYPTSNLNCACWELLSFQAWLTIKHWLPSHSNRFRLAPSNRWDG